MRENFDHTADLGLRIRCESLEGVFEEAAEALFAAIVEDLATVEPRQKLEIRLEGDQGDLLLFDWLKELLYHFDSDHLLFGKFQIRFEGNALHGCAWGEPLDTARHVLEHEVKAITYHGLSLEKKDDCWEAEVIVDI